MLYLNFNSRMLVLDNGGFFVFFSCINILKSLLNRTSSSASSRTLTRQSGKDVDSLEARNLESAETFLNEAFDAEGNAAEQVFPMNFSLKGSNKVSSREKLSMQRYALCYPVNFIRIVIF